jgi:hypothetical protein
MRLKFVLTLFALAFLVLGAALLLKPHMGGSPAISTYSTTAASGPALPTASNVEVTTAAPAESQTVPVAVSASVTNPIPAEQNPDAVDAEVNRLYELAMNNDPASLSNILTDLRNPHPEIREAAIEATKEFGSTNAIPALLAAAESTDDLQEKIAYLEAAHFLTLPPIDFGTPAQPSATPEQIQQDQQRRAARDARRQAQMQIRAGNQGSPTGAQNPSGQTPPTDSNP